VIGDEEEEICEESGDDDDLEDETYCVSPRKGKGAAIEDNDGGSDVNDEDIDVVLGEEEEEEEEEEENIGAEIPLTVQFAKELYIRQASRALGNVVVNYKVKGQTKDVKKLWKKDPRHKQRNC
jgi:hypothetical protein